MTIETDIPAQKHAMRTMMQDRLAAVTPDESSAWSGEVASLLYARLSGIRRVMLYWPLVTPGSAKRMPGGPKRTGTTREVDLRALVSSLLGAGAEVSLPRANWETRELEARQIRSPEHDLVPGRAGLLEPDGRCRLAPNFPDVIVTPGLAFDASGGRLGRGAGFYDRFLARIRAESPAAVCFIGAAFHIQLVDRIPREPFDQGIDEVWTERGRVAHQPAK